MTAIAAIRATERGKFLAAKTHAAAAAVAGMYFEFGFVDELHDFPRRRKHKGAYAAPLKLPDQMQTARDPACGLFHLGTGDNVDVRALIRTLDTKLDLAMRSRKQGVVRAHADIH